MDHRLAGILEGIGRVRALVVGDLMLDHYVWGSVERISPEAPVPVLRIDREENRAGGAGSVVANLAALEADVSVVSVVGDDPAGTELLSILREKGVDVSSVLRLPGRATTQKTRLLARVQQLLRVDRDVETLLADETARDLEQFALARVAEVDVVLCSDYGKGVLASGLAKRLAAACRKRGIPCVVDPFRHADFARYEGATTATPNRKETENATGVKPHDTASFEQAAKVLIEKLGLDFATITLDKDGIYLREKGSSRGEIFPAQARAVYDVAGAGDMVLSVLGLVLGAGGSRVDAVRLANVASGLEVERLGVAPIAKAEILRELGGTGAPPNLARKIVSEDEVASRLAEFRRQGKKVVFTNGCFDIVHAGHVRYFEFCRGQGDVLVVAVNSDDSVRRLKGPERPVNALVDRQTVLAGLAAVDLVTSFDETTPARIIERLKPDVLVKGEDYRDQVVVGRETVEAAGGRVVLAPLWPGVSTTRIIERIRT
ncbi:MAG TPA: D-glycero-beta-D-manno-heptose 1-phosphate adenylyltransferase [Planctomycetota bacterium]|nr:D-glycero-beta-D-manno-heptose 1-phosphate adenylyltransferase [Planctomycetota bacterium]